MSFNMLDVFRNEKQKEEKKLHVESELREKAEKKAIADYNVVRIDNVDYLTHFGIPVSTPEDLKTGTIGDRLESYRKLYVEACVKAGRLLLHEG